MPRGKFVNHKGRNRHFTNPEELEEQRRQEEEKKKWRKNKDLLNEDEEEDEKAAGGKKDSDDSNEGSDSETESESEDGKTKGIENLIQIENPNRVQKKAKKLSQLNEALANSSKPELSRREREQLEKQRAAANYQRLHAAGKTDEARADLARLAIIKQQREEAAKKRESEKKAKELATQKQKEMTQKALGKRS